MKRTICIIFTLLVAVTSVFSQTVLKNIRYNDDSHIIEMYGIQTSFDDGVYDVAVHCSTHNGMTEWFLVVDAPENVPFVNQIHIETDNNYCVYLEHPYRTSYIIGKPKMAVVHGTAVPYQDHAKYKRSVFRITENDLAHIQMDVLHNVSIIDKYDIKYTSGKHECKHIRTYIIKSYKKMQKMLV